MSQATFRKTASAAVESTLPHGQRIYVYRQYRTNQILYSLTRVLDPKALQQLPCLGKKTIPPGLRKDMWQPFARLTFSHPDLGLSAYRMLREFRKRHELEYPLETITYKEGNFKGRLMNRKDRAKVLMDQKANSVADMAAVLLKQASPPDPEKLEKLKSLKEGREKNKGYKAKFTNRVVIPQTGKIVARARLPNEISISHKYDIPDRDRGQMALRWEDMKGPVEILWKDTWDKEHATEWPEDTIHGELHVVRHHLLGQKPKIEEEKTRKPGMLQKLRNKIGRKKEPVPIVD
ncbi:MAG: hypothetical protein M1834_001014 [Cirrosporium novae-zelandiae]|nr:MAG: hypothetical protein M1834_001014 [Cirrosporium novae-zelandiae]